MEDFPPIPKALLIALDEMFPNTCPRIEDKDRMVWFKTGQRAVVEFLIEKYEQQNENILGSKK